ncbi:multidrug effflux MFS transporter [Mucilaginibacter panaciglaebae]|uniref:Multidrug effflux MFS transporter n=1 Tax=Mucilaginibacter panaciglaebae TaxID=502331 RepID=A0ABP7WHE6_9SPHI
MTKKRYFFTVLILGSLTALGPFSIDMYLPGFPAIAKSFHTTTAEISLSLSSFFIGLAAGQLLYGPLLDRFGRKRPLYVGLAVYLISSAGCYFCSDINSLIVLRFAQALGACAASVASMTMVRDIFPLNQNAKIFALLILILGASPMIAPTLGGYITEAWGWHLIFVVLGGMALVILLTVIFLLPESYKPNPDYSLKPAPIINSFLTVIKEPQFYTYAFAGAFSFASLFVYVSASPIVFMEVFKVSAKTYGWIFAALSVGFIGASQVNNLLLKRYKSEQIIWVALSTQVVVALLFVIGSWYHWYALGGTIGITFIMLCCVGTVSPNASALSLAPFEHNAGTASALLGAMQLGLGALMTLGIGLFKGGSALPMAGIMETTAVIGMLILAFGSKHIVHKVEVSEHAVVAH